jgi:hypothetical protein
MNKFTTNQFTTNQFTEDAKAAGRKAGMSSYRTWASVNDNPYAKGTEAFSAWAEAFKQAQHESNQDHDDSYLASHGGAIS